MIADRTEAVLVKALVQAEYSKLRCISQKHIEDAIGAPIPEGLGMKLAGGDFAKPGGDFAKRTLKKRARLTSFSRSVIGKSSPSEQLSTKGE